MKKKKSYLRDLGVYGFDHLEPLILASLISEDPILLIGKAGTGKTYLLNSISEALALEHRHYNASLISFDDLIGFPFPAEDKNEVRFLPTPATIWKSESVLIDELSRCKPEIQNKFFSIINEKKIQGIPLETLRYRWAAMNPSGFDGESGDESYSGSMPLDPALADRFAFIIEVPDWTGLSKCDQEAIVLPAGEGVLSDDNGALKKFIQAGRKSFLERINHPAPELLTYCRLVADFLNEAGLRISPRRARLLARNIVSLLTVENESENEPDKAKLGKLYKLALKCSLPQRAYRAEVKEHSVDSAHSEAMRLMTKSNPGEAWLSEFLRTTSLSKRLARLLTDNADMDTKSLAVLQMIIKDTPGRVAAFAFAAAPLLMKKNILNDEALNELLKISKKIMKVDGKMRWKDYRHKTQSVHPDWSKCQQYLSTLSKNDARAKRAKQLFLYLVTENVSVGEPQLVENELNELFGLVNQQKI